MRYVVSENVTDFQIGYAFNGGIDNSLSLRLQVNNVTDTPYQTNQTTKDHPLKYQKFGHTFLAGATYRF